MSHTSARDSLRVHGRESSSQQPPRQRPRLLRSSATEPSITASNAIRGPPANSVSSPKATDLLSRVAVSSPPPVDFEQSPDSGVVSHQVDAIVICRGHHERSPTGGQSISSGDSPPGYYFSFPSFDDWEDMHKDVDKDTGD